VPTNYLYFDVPASFAFTSGVPVYVRIEYHDAGSGKLSPQYDSTYGDTTADKYKAAEIHTRSSRVGGAEFVYSYQCFQSPRLANRQNGATDFRFTLSGSDGTPLRIASVQISTTPYADAQLTYALAKPWLSPYAGPSKDFVNNQTLVGKVLAGYQVWFATPNDADDLGWRHWGSPTPDKITVDMWPWLEEYNANQVYPAGAMVHQDGRPAYLFSSRDPETVQRHFRWMRKHNIDGAYLQRFVTRGLHELPVLERVERGVAHRRLPPAPGAARFGRDNLLEDMVPGAGCHAAIAVLQVNLGALQVHGGLAGRDVFGLHQLPRFGRVPRLQTGAFSGERVHAVERALAVSATDQAITCFHELRHATARIKEDDAARQKVVGDDSPAIPNTEGAPGLVSTLVSTVDRLAPKPLLRKQMKMEPVVGIVPNSPIYVAKMPDFSG